MALLHGSECRQGSLAIDRMGSSTTVPEIHHQGGSLVVRGMIETLTRDWVIRRRLSADFSSAPIHVTPSAGLRYLFRPMNSVDPTLLELAREFVTPGSVVWDIGANVGLFSFAAASMAGPEGLVVALEPDAWLVQLLRRSSLEQPAGSAAVQVIPAAVAAEVSLRTLCLATRSRRPIIWPNSGRPRPAEHAKNSR